MITSQSPWGVFLELLTSEKMPHTPADFAWATAMLVAWLASWTSKDLWSVVGPDLAFMGVGAPGLSTNECEEHPFEPLGRSKYHPADGLGPFAE